MFQIIRILLAAMMVTTMSACLDKAELKEAVNQTLDGNKTLSDESGEDDESPEDSSGTSTTTTQAPPVTTTTQAPTVTTTTQVSSNPVPPIELPPPPTPVSPTPVDPPNLNSCAAAAPGFISPGTISVQNVGASTSLSQVNLQIFRKEAFLMKVSPTADCRCGEWELYSTSKVWNLVPNAVNAISVQFKDFDAAASTCTSISVLQDSQGPSIHLVADPNNTYRANSNQYFHLRVTDPGSGLQNASCSLNNQPVACNVNNGQQTVITLPGLLVGDYTFEVKATDQVGVNSSKSVQFSIVPEVREVLTQYEVKQSNKVDLLMIIDNSGSMQYEQKNMAQRVGSMMNLLQGLDYKIGITTTDPSNTTYGDGRLVQMNGLAAGTFVLDKSVPLSTAQTVLGNTLQRKETGSGSEQAIYATYRALERYFDPNDKGPHKGLFRTDAALAALVISDEDESANNFKNKPENLINFVKTKWPGKPFAFHSIITRPGDVACKNTNGAAYGEIYKKISELTGFGATGGALIGDVCASDYATQLAGIGNSIKEMVNIIELSCQPYGSTSISVDLNGAAYTGSYQVEGKKLVFDQPLEVGKFNVRYWCL
jgi:hypothetical protein